MFRKESMWKNICILFLFGGLISIVLNVIQAEYKFSNNFGLFLKNNWWIIPICGLSAVYIGLMYPYIDWKFGEYHAEDREWTSIIRCVGFFLGLNHFSSKLTFANNYHFFFFLMIFCLLFWYWFDKTKPGFCFNLFHALFVTTLTFAFRVIGMFSLSELSFIHFYYLQTCLLWFVFSGCITVGNIGRIMNLQIVHEHEA